MIQQIWWRITEAVILLEDSSIYFAILLGRCAMLSFPVSVLVVVLRRTLLKKAIFLRGMIWGILFVVPFMGKLDLFYDYSSQICSLFIWWNDICMICRPVGYGYILCMFVAAGCMLHKRREVHRMLQNMKEDCVCGQEILINEMTVTPFTAGLIHAKLVIPQIMLERFKTEELELILLHERIHIRLGHLWKYFFWDVMRILLWPNLFLAVCTKEFRSDMEDICDRVTIQQSQRCAYEYGNILLKSIKILQPGRVDAEATFTGDQDYRNTKQRIMKIADHNPYKKWKLCVIYMCCLSVLAGIFCAIRENSFPRYRKDYDMVLMNDIGKTVILKDSKMLRKAISANEENVFINRKEMEYILNEYGIEETDFWILFGGYEKLPGFGGRGNLIHVDFGGMDKVLQIPYQNSDQYISTIIFKMM